MAAPNRAKYAPKIVFPVNLYQIDKLKKTPKNKFASNNIETTRKPLSS